MEGFADSFEVVVVGALDLRGSEGDFDFPGFGGEGDVFGRGGGILGHFGFGFGVGFGVGFEGGEDEVFDLCDKVKEGFQFAVHGD